MKHPNAMLAGQGTTIFETMSRLAEAHGAVNLGQGFPDRGAPPEVADMLAIAARAATAGWNQYPPMPGLPALRQAVAAHEARFYGLNVDWQREVLVTSGATEALAACLFGLLEPGDEAVLIQPFYDSYLPIIQLAGAAARFVTLVPPDWRLSRAALDAAFSARTKLIVLNTPLNPAAKVFDGEELALIAEYLERFDAYAICDEVYEHLVYGGARHLPLIALPGMRRRVLRIGSAGKTFSLTGWKVGYVVGSPAMIAPAMKAHQFLTFTTPPHLQVAVAHGLAKDDAYFTALAAGMAAKRDLLASGLAGIGLPVLPGAGTYFLIADIRPLAGDEPDDVFCRRMTIEAGVTAIPVSAFYAEDAPRHLIRFCFCKEDAVLSEAVARLTRAFGRTRAA